ncbi:MAG: sel1 repeat family protein [Bacteroidetes bacterium]|nr:sel1 repeat family protein [Bacteroidota bacterium]
MLLFLFAISAIYAQTGQRVVQTENGPITIKWQVPLTAWTASYVPHVVTQNGVEGAHGGIYLYWEKSQCNSDGIIVGKPRISINNADPGITIHDVYVEVVGTGCKGEHMSGVFYGGDIQPYEHKMTPNWDTHNFLTITKVIACHFSYELSNNVHYYVEYDEEKGISKILINGKDQDQWLKDEQEKYKDVKKQFETLHFQFFIKVQAFQQKLNNVKDVSLKNQYTVILNNTVAQFNARYESATKNYQGEDDSKIKQQLDDLNKIQGDFAKSLDELTTKQNDAEQQASVNVNSLKNSDPVTGNQNNGIQNQTQQYINNAQNPNNDAMSNQLALNQAKINAMRSGGANTSQQQQINQLQQKQNAVNQQALTSITTELVSSINSLLLKKHDETSQINNNTGENQIVVSNTSNENNSFNSESKDISNERAQNLNSLPAPTLQTVNPINTNNLISVMDCMNKADAFAQANDYQQEFKWYKIAADENIAQPTKADLSWQPIALFNVGKLYEHGQGVGQSNPMAFSYYQKSANRDFQPAVLAVAQCYEQGKGTPKNLQKAIELYKRAASMTLWQDIADQAKAALKRLNQ